MYNYAFVQSKSQCLYPSHPFSHYLVLVKKSLLTSLLHNNVSLQFWMLPTVLYTRSVARLPHRLRGFRVISLYFLPCTLPYLNNLWVPIGKKPAPGDHEFNLKIIKCRWIVCLGIVVSVSCINAKYSYKYIIRIYLIFKPPLDLLYKLRKIPYFTIFQYFYSVTSLLL